MIRFTSQFPFPVATGVLANALFDYPDNRTLLLSATPYKMFTAAGDEDDDHHRDFVRTIDFLLGDDSHRFHQALRRFQEVLLDVGGGGDRERLAAFAHLEPLRQRFAQNRVHPPPAVGPFDEWEPVEQ